MGSSQVLIIVNVLILSISFLVLFRIISETPFKKDACTKSGLKVIILTMNFKKEILGDSVKVILSGTIRLV